MSGSGVERTRATFLSFAEPDQVNFTAELTALLPPGSPIDLVQESFLAMAAGGNAGAY